MDMARIDPAIFRDTPLCEGLSEDETLVMADFFQERQMTAGMTVFIENMPGESLYLIQHGEVEISKMLAEGDEQSLVKLGPKEIFGEMAILDGQPRAASARINEDAMLLVINRSEFERFCREHPEPALRLTLNIIRIFSGRIRENNEEYREMLLVALGRKEPV